MEHNPFLSAYEFGKRFHLPRLRSTIEKAEAAYQDLQPETVDYCKCIIETQCKHIMKENNPDFNEDVYRKRNKRKGPKLITYAEDALKDLGTPEGARKAGIKNLIRYIAETRNQQTIAGHGRMGTQPFMEESEMEHFILTFEMVTKFFLASINESQPDIRNTQLRFKDLEATLNIGELNEQADRQVSVDYNEEEGLLYINGKELRPSEILYHFDRASYAEQIEKRHDDIQGLIELILQDHGEGV